MINKNLNEITTLHCYWKQFVPFSLHIGLINYNINIFIVFITKNIKHSADDKVYRLSTNFASFVGFSVYYHCDIVVISRVKIYQKDIQTDHNSKKTDDMGPKTKHRKLKTK